MTPGPPVVPVVRDPIVVELDAAAKRPPVQGFLYFGDDLHKDLVDPLRPAFWRTTIYGTTGAFDLFSAYGAGVTYVVGDAYVQAHGGPASATPWQDWAEYEGFVKSLVTQAKKAGIAVTYWDVWNEPESTWGGTQAQHSELLERSISAIRSIDPAAKIVAPSMAGLSPGALAQVLARLDEIAAGGARIDAFAFHAFDDPDGVPAFADQARTFFKGHPALCQPTCPEIHVNEYSSGQHDHLPGWALAWLAGLDRASLDWVSKACWNVPQSDGSTLSGCGHGLGGLFGVDGVTPQPTYWVHRAYAEMETRILVDGMKSGWTVVGGRTGNGDARVLVGRHGCGANHRWCTFADHAVDDEGASVEAGSIDVRGAFGSGAVDVTVQRIPRLAPGVALASLEMVSQLQVSVQSGAVQVPLDAVADGAVLVVSIHPH